MKVLVTGAGGLLGRAVVTEFLRRGHNVRAMVRPAAAIEEPGWEGERMETFRADLRAATNLTDAFEGVDTLVHLAAAVTGDEDLQFASTVVGTERLLEAMALSQTRSVVLVSSFSVYDWSKVRRSLTETSPLESDVYKRDGYAIAKLWQERITRRMAEKLGSRLTVVRPGFIWGRGNELVAGVGQKLGRFLVVMAPLARLPLTHAANCADACVTIAERSGESDGETFNVVDGHAVTNWRYAGHYCRQSEPVGFRVPIPYWVGIALVRTIGAVSHLLFNGAGKLPSMFVTPRFQARFKPVNCDYAKLRQRLGWSPPLTFDECLRLTYGGGNGGTAPARPKKAIHTVDAENA